LSRLASVISITLAVLAAGGTIAVAASPPGAKTGGAGAVTPQTATIRGSINPHGVPTAYYFRFGTTTTYGTRTSTGDAGAGTRSIAVSAALTGLRPNTRYHYQLVAFSTAGTTRGADRTFKTPQIPTTAALATSPNPVVYGGVVSIAGTLTGPDVAGKQVALQGNPFPFTGPFQQIGNSVLTTPTGGYSFMVPVLVTTQLRVVDQAKPSVTSPVVIEGVALATSMRAHRSRRHPGRVRVIGHVTPARVGNAVLIQRHTRKGWKTVALTLTRAKRNATYSRFSRRLRLHRGARLRAVVRTIGGDYADGVSRSVPVRRG
jgi:hypothetical protein